MNCDDGENCRDLAVLMGGNRDGFKVELIRDGLEENRTVGTGSPFYFSWSPEGDEMVWQRNNRRLDVFDVVEGETDALDVAPGLFPAPMWSPVNDRLLVGSLNRDDFTTDLVVIEGNETNTLLAGINGLVAFNWSPDGEYIAYRVLNRQGYSALRVIDGETGAEIAQSNIENVFAFFWSPDSTKVAYVVPDQQAGTFDANFEQVQQNEIELRWMVLDITTGDIQRYTRFSPTLDMVYILSYFDQFAQSHRFWSPDSRFIVFGERLRGGESSISILDIDNPNTVPFSLADGVLGIWSYQ